jgi:hypothetical protein
MASRRGVAGDTPFGPTTWAAQDGCQGALRTIGILIRVDTQHDARHFAPVGTFRIGIQHPYVPDGMVPVVRGEHRLGRRKVESIRV